MRFVEPYNNKPSLFEQQTIAFLATNHHNLLFSSATDIIDVVEGKKKRRWFVAMGKDIIINKETSYMKSNEMALAQLNRGLNLAQSQILAFAIYTIQKEGVSEFRKVDFSRMFEREYHPRQLKKDAEDLFKLHLNMSAPTEKNPDHMRLVSVFRVIEYDKGTIRFKWEDEIVPHIFNLKNSYILNDLKITMNFSSSHSWVLYEYIKANYGKSFVRLSLKEIREVFGVQENKSYQKSSYMFKTRVLIPSIEDINNFTEFEMEFEEVKKGRAIIGYILRWTKGKAQIAASKKQLEIIEDLNYEVINYATDLIIKIDNIEDIAVLKEVISDSKKLYLASLAADFKSKEADDYIKKFLGLKKKLTLIEDQSNRPTVDFYNWLEERD